MHACMHFRQVYIVLHGMYIRVYCCTAVHTTTEKPPFSSLYYYTAAIWYVADGSSLLFSLSVLCFQACFRRDSPLLTFSPFSRKEKDPTGHIDIGIYILSCLPHAPTPTTCRFCVCVGACLGHTAVKSRASSVPYSSMHKHTPLRVYTNVVFTMDSSNCCLLSAMRRSSFSCISPSR